MARDVFGDDVDDAPPAASGGQRGAELPPQPFEVSTASGSGETGRDFGGPSPIVGIAQISPPMAWLAIAAIAVVLSLLLGLAAHGRPTLALLGWLAGGFIAI